MLYEPIKLGYIKCYASYLLCDGFIYKNDNILVNHRYTNGIW